MKKSNAIDPIGDISASILLIRGRRVLLDSDLASLYNVSTKALNQAVKRNADRFPADFVFRLGEQEFIELNRSQTVTGSHKHRDPRFPPFAFTEHGSIMAATVLNSSRAVHMSIFVVRAFLRLRDILATNQELARQFAELERRVSTHDQAITGILKTIRELMNPPTSNSRPIGFTANIDEK